MKTMPFNTLPAGRALDKLIAERLGWTFTEEEVVYEADTRDHDCATFPGDKVYGGAHAALVARLNGERRGWAHNDPPRTGDPKSDEAVRYTHLSALLSFVGIPHYSTSANAALELVAGLHVEMVQFIDQMPGYLVVVTDEPRDGGWELEDSLSPRGEATTLPLAICRAWTTWRLSKPISWFIGPGGADRGVHALPPNPVDPEREALWDSIYGDESEEDDDQDGDDV